MKLSREEKFAWFFICAIAAFILVAISSCKKDKTHVEPEKIVVTYSFYSQHTPYCVRIWDVTNINDFQDSVYTNSFSKSISYDYNETFRGQIDAKQPANMQIQISSGGKTNNCTDSLYSNLNCFIDL